MAVLHLQGSEIWGAGWSQGEAQDYVVAIWPPGQPALVWSHGKNGDVETRGAGLLVPQTPSRAEPPSVALGPPGALCGVTVSAPSPPDTPGHSVPETHPAAIPDEQVPRHVQAHTLHAELWV